MRALQEIFESNSGGGFIAYHGSRHKFDRFDDNKIRNGITAGWGHYFTESQQMATHWVDTTKSGWLYKVRLNITVDEIAYLFAPLDQQPNVLRAFQEITSKFNPKQDAEMFAGIDLGKDNASARRIRYPLEGMSYSTAITRLAGVFSNGWTKPVHERKAAMLLKAHGIHAVCYHDLGAPSGIHNFNCFDSSRIEILSRTKT